MNVMDGAAPADILAASLAVGVLFVVRFALAMRRIRHDVGSAWSGGVEAWRDVARPMAYGAAFEPNRRHALRQLVLGLFFVALSALLGIWLGGAAVFGWRVPFGTGLGA